MFVKKLELDTFAHKGTEPDYGSLTLNVEGRIISIRLDERQVRMMTEVATALGRELLAEMALRGSEAA